MWRVVCIESLLSLLFEVLIDCVLICFLRCLIKMIAIIVAAKRKSGAVSPIGRGSLGVSAHPGIPTSSSSVPLPESLLPPGLLLEEGVLLPKGV